MEIQNFKMRVTPEQSRIVQQMLFNNGCQWESGSKKVINTDKPFLYLEDESIQFDQTYSGAFYNNYNLPELTFQEFFDRYVKWCIRGSKELAKWERVVMNGRCDYFLNAKENYYFPKTKDLIYWNAVHKLPETYIELTFEQFEKYVLKSKESKNMEKKIIGYKLKEDFKQYEEAAIIIATISKESFYSWIPKVGYNFSNGSELYFRFKKAGVLNLWFEPVYEESSKELYFGKVKFTIKKGDNYATTEYGNVTKEEIGIAINYIENPPKLNNYTFGVRMEKGTTTYTLDIIEKSKEASIAFGCQEGTYKELKAIYNAFE